MWDKIWELAFDIQGVSALLWILTHLILIVIYGKVNIYEPNDWILYTEIVYTSLAAVNGIIRTVKDCKR